MSGGGRGERLSGGGRGEGISERVRGEGCQMGCQLGVRSDVIRVL